jgi:hypothetical protein
MRSNISWRALFQMLPRGAGSIEAGERLKGSPAALSTESFRRAKELAYCRAKGGDGD